ncbi:SusC/RagA family TonB-linked outer membrane protein [Flavivirga jejuensis]|uniref:TonB-dependent receptor n=1 Tax=Flavivirga jejuensis TaxID=870487 RepID=A0ABT8WVF2_9FLAO|nr:TonB-dependent receptor [Flavivirga jejuensis]MDO5976871.1 TonB-dependent receptor [Flavivirga jejuensis]
MKKSILEKRIYVGIKPSSIKLQLSMFLFFAFLLKVNAKTEAVVNDWSLKTIITNKNILQQTVTGIITDKNGEPLPGVNILVVGTKKGALSDFDGTYTVSANTGEVISFSYVGMKNQTVLVGGQNKINIIMEEEASQLDEVVIVGYGTQKKGNLTGSVASIKSEKLTVAPITSAANALVGQLPGLSALQSSGLPGSDAATLRIRGFGAALVIVDGIEGDLNSLDPNQIESISILKDGAASIYGARAGNGVILVKTKRGKNQKPIITLNSSYTLQGVTSILHPASSGQIAEMEREQHIQSGGDPATAPWTQEAIDKFYEGGDPAYLNTDWYDHTFRDWAPQQNHNLSVRGGSENIKYFGYFGYAKQETMVKTNGGDYQRYNAQSNVDANITDDLKISIDLSLAFKDKNFPVRGLDNEGAFWQDYYRTRPWYPATLPDATKVPWGGIDVGSIATVSNIDLMGYNRSNDKNLRGITTLTYDFKWIEGLQAKANVNYVTSDVYTKRYQKPIVFWTYNPANDEYTASASFSESNLSEAAYRSSVFTQQYSLNYNNKFANKHEITALALYESIGYKSNYLSASRTDLLTPSIDQLFIGSTTGMGNDGSASEMGRMSYVGRLNYSFDNRYLLETIFRADASAKFPSENRWGYFPSISLGWVINREKFMRNISNLDNLKLRASYGESGNDAVGDFQYLSGYSTLGSVIFDEGQLSGLYITGLSNPFLTWEKMAIYNTGIDFSFNNQKIYGSIEAFYRERTGIPATRITSLPSTFGSSLPPENLNSLNDRGFDLSIGTKGSSGDFSYDISGNISWSRSKWDYYEEPEYDDPDQERLYKQSGEWTDRVMGYVSDGLFTSLDEINALDFTYEELGGNSTLMPGDVKYKDLNNDGVLNWKDQTEIGKGAFPHWTYGLNTLFQYKNFTLTTLFQGAFGYSTNVNVTEYQNEVMYNLRWTEENNDPNALVSRLGGASSNGYASDYRLKDTSYIRLKTASLSYQFPQSTLDKLGIVNLRIYAAGTNLFTISSLSDYGVDPEVLSGSLKVYPQQRTISLGMNLSL